MSFDFNDNHSNTTEQHLFAVFHSVIPNNPDATLVVAFSAFASVCRQSSIQMALVCIHASHFEHALDSYDVIF